MAVSATTARSARQNLLFRRFSLPGRRLPSPGRPYGHRPAGGKGTFEHGERGVVAPAVRPTKPSRSNTPTLMPTIV